MTAQSTVKPRRSRRPAETRERLIAAAVEVLTERGFEAASTDEIVQRSGLTNGALYNHFSTRYELLAAALEQEVARIEEIVGTPGSRPGDVIENLLQTVRAWDRLSPRSGGVIVEVIARARRDEAVRALYLRLATSVEAGYIDELRRGQESGRVRRDLQPEAIARLLSAIGTGYNAQAAAGRPDVENNAWIAVLEHLIESLRPSAADDPKDTQLRRRNK